VFDWGYDMRPANSTYGIEPDEGEGDGVVNWNDNNYDVSIEMYGIVLD
jgi:hypothetical protein